VTQGPHGLALDGRGHWALGVKDTRGQRSGNGYNAFVVRLSTTSITTNVRLKHEATSPGTCPLWWPSGSSSNCPAARQPLRGPDDGVWVFPTTVPWQHSPAYPVQVSMSTGPGHNILYAGTTGQHVNHFFLSDLPARFGQPSAPSTVSSVWTGPVEHQRQYLDRPPSVSRPCSTAFRSPSLTLGKHWRLVATPSSPRSPRVTSFCRQHVQTPYRSRSAQPGRPQCFGACWLLRTTTVDVGGRAGAGST